MRNLILAILILTMGWLNGQSGRFVSINFNDTADLMILSDRYLAYGSIGLTFINDYGRVQRLGDSLILNSIIHQDYPDLIKCDGIVDEVILTLQDPSGENITWMFNNENNISTDTTHMTFSLPIDQKIILTSPLLKNVGVRKEIDAGRYVIRLNEMALSTDLPLQGKFKVQNDSIVGSDILFIKH